MRRYPQLILLITILGFISCSASNEQTTPPPYVILVSFDGFRHDYVEKYNTPNFKKFINKGAAADVMLSSFPSKTFPNHYTVVTGMYPGNHGLIDNNFYDEDLDIQYSIRNREAVETPAFYGGLPLWQLVQDNDMKSASYFWVGSETKIQGRFPNYYYTYDGSVPNETRIDQIVNWLQLPETERPNFISLYFSLVDSQGHATGPDAPETGATVLEADRLLGLLMEQLKGVDLPVNVIITSDHGMNSVPSTDENLIVTKDIMDGIDPDSYRLVSSGAHAHVYVEDETKRAQIFNTIQSRENHFKTYLKEDIPEKWHFQHKRVGDIFFTMQADYYLSTTGRKNGLIARGGVTGQHGFDPYTTPDMGAIFYAQGPNIKPGSQVGSFENINVYPLIAHILGIEEYPEIDGDLSVLLPVYQK